MVMKLELVTFHRRLLEAKQSVAPSNGNNTSANTHDTPESNFDTNTVIILSALLCALIFALGFNSIVRCALRCGRRFTGGEERSSLATGLKKRELNQIPVAVYGSSGSGTRSIQSTECPICLAEFVRGEKVRVLPKCNHGFHVRCIDTWLMSHSSCPNCRHSLLEPMTTTVTYSADGGTLPITDRPGRPLEEDTTSNDNVGRV